MTSPIPKERLDALIASSVAADNEENPMSELGLDSVLVPDRRG